MAEGTLGFWDYVKAAFWFKPRVKFFGPLPINLMAIASCFVVSLLTRNPGFLLLGGGAEVAYLAFLSSNSTFQKLIQGQQLLKKQAGVQAKVQFSLQRLHPVSLERYRRLYEQCLLILGISERAAPEDMSAIRDLRSGGLNQLLWLFLRLLTSKELMETTLSGANRKNLEAEVVHLKERLNAAGPESPLARSLQGTLDIQSKRLENLNRAQSSLEVINAELERIEKQVELIREESAITTSPDSLSSRLDAVTATLGETSKWMDQHLEFFGSLGADEEQNGLPAPQLLAPPPQAPAPPPATPPPPKKLQQ